MNGKRILLAVLLIIMLLMPVSAYKGKQLARSPVENFILTDQMGEDYSFYEDSNEVTVIAFVFTRCPDVCPVITQLLKSVDDSLSENEKGDVTFISMSVDPRYDTPERLKAFTELHGVEWPHLTDTSEDIASHHEWVKNTFGVVVEESVINAHVMEYQPGEASVTLVNTTGNSSTHMFGLSGWTLTETLADQAQIEINASVSQYGHYITGIGGDEIPLDGSWYWELNLWNKSSSQWEASQVGIDEIDALHEDEHIAWIPSSLNRSNLSMPLTDTEASMTIIWNNGTELQIGLDTYGGYHITKGALNDAGINITLVDSTDGHYLTSLQDEASPEDGSWGWNLYTWNNTNTSWEISPVGMDDVEEPRHIAWAPSTVNASEIPSPMKNSTGEVCSGHGWEMGTGSSLHCMCNDGYTWDGDDKTSCVEDFSEDFSVGHSTITYIFNENRQPVVAWPGDSWKVPDFTADLREVLKNDGLGDSDPLDTPGMTFALASLGLSLAVVLRPSIENKLETVNKRKGKKRETSPLQ
ncbi:MAG TPA: SCO family protein [Poseidonia sp.]|nr:SCO family protein [Poseidonia sp.]